MVLYTYESWLKIQQNLRRRMDGRQRWLDVVKSDSESIELSGSTRLAGLEIVKSSPGGGNRVIPNWAETALSKRLQESENGFASYGAVQEWPLQTLGVEAEYHAVDRMTRYRLKAKLKVVRPQYYKQVKSNVWLLKKRMHTPLAGLCPTR